MIIHTIAVHCDRCITSVEVQVPKGAAPDVIRQAAAKTGWTNYRKPNFEVVDLCPGCASFAEGRRIKDWVEG